MRRYLAPRLLVRHLAMLILVAGCLALGWWQIGRAAGGNALSFGYAIEWPVFALFVIFMWYREVQMALRGARPETEPVTEPVTKPMRQPQASQPQASQLQASQLQASQLQTSQVPARPAAPEPSIEDDPELVAYNDMLAWLAEDPSRRPADYRAPVTEVAHRSGGSGARRAAGR